MTNKTRVVIIKAHLAVIAAHAALCIVRLETDGDNTKISDKLEHIKTAIKEIETAEGVHP